MTKVNPNIFKAYDIRGVYPDEINEEVVIAIAKALSDLYEPKRVLVTSDGRLSSPQLKKALIKVFSNSAEEVFDGGLTTTDEFYFGVIKGNYDLGLMVTASHNPKNYNGIKIVGSGAKPFTGDKELLEIKNRVIAGRLDSTNGGENNYKEVNYGKDYVEKLLSFFTKNTNRLKIVLDPGNGMAAPFVDPLFADENEIVKICENVDGEFACRGPNPIAEGALNQLSQKVLEEKADLGMAWDSDADRMVAVAEDGRIIPGDFLVALLARKMLADFPNSHIVYDVRASRATIDTINELGGTGIMSRVGHSYIKKQMRELNAVFGGENSGHFYIRDFYYLDSGLLSALYLVDLVKKEGKKLSELLAPFYRKYFLTGEVNFKTKNGVHLIQELEKKYSDGKKIDIDGVRVEFPGWWFGVRLSNTEPLLRLNLEANTEELKNEKLKEISEMIKNFG